MVMSHECVCGAPKFDAADSRARDPQVPGDRATPLMFCRGSGSPLVAGFRRSTVRRLDQRTTSRRPRREAGGPGLLQPRRHQPSSARRPRATLSCLVAWRAEAWPRPGLAARVLTPRSERLRQQGVRGESDSRARSRRQPQGRRRSEAGLRRRVGLRGARRCRCRWRSISQH